MTDHLSDFALDHVRLGAPRQAHLESCPDCQQRLTSMQQLADHSASTPAFARIARTAQLIEPRRQWRWWPALVAAAAALALVLVRASMPVEAGTSRLKGRPTIDVLRPSRTASTVWHPGETAIIHVEPHGHAEAVVFAISELGEIEQLWPADGGTSAPVPLGGALAEAVVTPGSTRLVAGFFDSHTSTEAFRAALKKSPYPQGPIANAQDVAVLLMKVTQ